MSATRQPETETKPKTVRRLSDGKEFAVVFCGLVSMLVRHEREQPFLVMWKEIGKGWEVEGR